MKRSSVLLCVLTAIAPGAVSAQTVDSQELLGRVRANVTDTLARLPKYMCSLTIDRAQYAADAKQASSCDGPPHAVRLAETDRLKLDVAVAADGEIYAWPGASVFDTHDPFDFVRTGATGNGVYSSFLSAIFGGNVAEISYQGIAEEGGRRLAQFAFRVPQQKSNYAVRIGNGHYTTAYGGTFLADPATGDLVQLAIHAQGLPASSGACEVNTTLDYSRSRLRDEEFLLPGQTQLDIFKTDGSEDRNHAVYSGCREFTAQSSIRFGAPDPAPGLAATPVSTTPIVQAPAGVRLRVRFPQRIDTATAAGGDTVKAVLVSAIRDSSSKTVLAPDGSEIVARITRLEQIAGSKQSIRMEVRLEGVRTPHGLVALKALANPAATDGAEAAHPRVRAASGGGTTLGLGGPPAPPNRVLLGRLHTDSGTYVFEFPDEKPGFVIKAGLESSWVTGK